MSADKNRGYLFFVTASSVGCFITPGEIGLDGSAQFKPVFGLQCNIFGQILVLTAKANNKILTIHSRNAAAETIELLTKHISKTKCKIILHWYSGDLINLKKALEIGCHFSINHKMVGTAKGHKSLYLSRSRIF